MITYTQPWKYMLVTILNDMKFFIKHEILFWPELQTVYLLTFQSWLIFRQMLAVPNRTIK